MLCDDNRKSKQFLKLLSEVKSSKQVVRTGFFLHLRLQGSSAEENISRNNLAEAKVFYTKEN